MTAKIEEMILDQLFKLSDKVDKIQEELKTFAKKDDLKKFATKDDLKKFATKDDLLQMESRIYKNVDKKIDEKLKKQAEEISEVFITTFQTTDKTHKEMEENTNRKIQSLRNELIACQKQHKIV